MIILWSSKMKKVLLLFLILLFFLIDNQTLSVLQNTGQYLVDEAMLYERYSSDPPDPRGWTKDCPPQWGFTGERSGWKVFNGCGYYGSASGGASGRK